MKFATSTTLLVALVGSFPMSPTSAAELTAGVATVDLTPPAEMKAALGGYGERMSRPAEGVHDPIFAKALVVSDGPRRFALVTADVLAFPPPIKPAVVKKLAEAGVACDQVMLLPSHSHTSIDMSAINPGNVFGIPQIGIYQPELYEMVVERLFDVIRRAGSDLQPIVVGTSSLELDGWNRNRRQSGGPTDPTLTVTRIDTLEGEPLVALTHFTAHPTFMGAEHMQFSGGWPGHLQRRLETLIGRDAVVMYANGAQGDVSPVSRPDSGPSRWDVAKAYGEQLALEAQKVWQDATPSPDVAFGFHTQTIELPERVWHGDFMETGGKEYSLSEKLLAKMLPLMFPPQTDVVSLRLGELLIVGVPGELTARLGQQIKNEAATITGAKYAVVGGLADAWISYILTEDEYRSGGYEASVSFYGPTLGETIVTGALKGVKQLPTASRDL